MSYQNIKVFKKIFSVNNISDNIIDTKKAWIAFLSTVKFFDSDLFMYAIAITIKNLM